MESKNMSEKEFEEYQELLARELGTVDSGSDRQDFTEKLRSEAAAHEAAKSTGRSLREVIAEREAAEKNAEKKPLQKESEQEKSEPEKTENTGYSEEIIDLESILSHRDDPPAEEEPVPEFREKEMKSVHGKYEKVTDAFAEDEEEYSVPSAEELSRKHGKYEKMTEDAEGYFDPELPGESAFERRMKARKTSKIIRYAAGLSILFVVSLSAGLIVNTIKMKNNGGEQPVSNIQTDAEGNTVSSAEAGKGNSGIVSITPVNAFTAVLEGGSVPIQISMATTGPATADDLMWQSSDPSVAEVTEDGVINGIKAGSCIITISSKADPSVGAQIECRVRKMEKKDGVTYVDGILLINKSYGVDKDYGPGDLTEETQNAFNELCSAAAVDNLNIYLASGYRSYETQTELFEGYTVTYGRELADTFSARPGFSEHQSGLAIDVNSIDDSFADTPEAKWLAENCTRFGFIIRYEKDKVGITGYKYEPWHIRYVGKELAQEVTSMGITLEEYLGVDSVYKDDYSSPEPEDSTDSQSEEETEPSSEDTDE